MTNEAVAPLEQLAAEQHAELIDRWGRSSLSIERDVDLQRVHDLTALAGYTVTAYFGEERNPLVLGDRRPDQLEVAGVAAMAPNERIHAEVAAAATATEAARRIQNQIVEIEVRYMCRGWARTEEAFRRSVASDWAAVANDMPEDRAQIGNVVLLLEKVASADTGGAVPVIVPIGESPTDRSTEVWDLLWQLADAAAWTNLAVSVNKVGGVVTIALHSDQDAAIPITLESARCGTTLLRWLLRDTDGNREEALRYVFRFVTAASTHQLPDSRTVQKLAERQRIALTRDRAAEVFRAIADGNRDTAALLDSSARSLSDLVEDTTKTANATVVGVLGVVALVARTSDSLPAWLVALATSAAILGVIAVVVSRWRRIGDQETAATRLLARLENDPLLPTEEQAAAKTTIEDFQLGRRATNARRAISALGATACAVAVSGAVWLIWFHDDGVTVTNVTPTSTATTTSTSASPSTTFAPSGPSPSSRPQQWAARTTPGTSRRHYSQSTL